MIDLFNELNLKKDSYNSILFIMNWPTKIIEHELIKISINTSKIVKIIIYVKIY